MSAVDLAGPAALTPERLTSILRRDPALADLEVATVTATAVGAGQMARSYRLALTYAGERTGAPASVIAKLPSDDPASLAMAQATGGYAREVRFYERLASRLSVRTPRCWHAEIDERQESFALILEDLSPAVALDQFSSCSVDQAALALDQAARLHDGSWRAPWLASEEWLPSTAIWRHMAQAIPDLCKPFVERFGPHLDAHHVEVVERLAREVGRWVDTLDEPRCLWHADFRLDNLLYDGQDGAVPITVIDWQSIATAPGVIDVPFFLGTSMSEADRATHQDELIGDYHAALMEHGATDYTLDACRRDCRLHALYPLVLTVPVSMGVEATERGDRMFGAMARRAAAQIADNDSFKELPA